MDVVLKKLIRKIILVLNMTVVYVPNENILEIIVLSFW